MPKATNRPALPTSSSDFALPPSSSSPVASSSTLTLDDPTFLLQRFRRPSLLQKAGYLSESRLHSPLASSFTLHARRRSQNAHIDESSESDKERMLTDSPSSSEAHTPVTKLVEQADEETRLKNGAPKTPRTPPRRKSSTSMDTQDNSSVFSRRIPFTLKQPRILNLLAEETRPEEAEVKSEAAFQRLVTSCSELPHTPRTLTDRGRYPEEAGHDEELQREETPSDDEEHIEGGPFAFSPPLSTSEPINILKTRTLTPVGSTSGSLNGDDPMSAVMSEMSSSLGASAMDIDMPTGSPAMSTMVSTPMNQWRYTPPPTSTSAVRSNKRKLDDRFDPYPTASKRRAVSPSLMYLRDAHTNIGSPASRSTSSRIPIAIPINIPNSTTSSATSSPTISSSYPTSFSRPVSITSSPTLRATMGLASPILRPIPRTGRRVDEDEREVEGAGDAVGCLTLT
ncbi:hypothetical protein BDQ17DRAFT_1418635 [Cyathus striatus]|nr:hypothetical protein BDQ17DRAFT_1418635 [Cyathus striatus]